MAKFPPLFKGIEKKIPQLFQELKINPIKKENILKKIKEGMGRFYNPICEDKKKRKYFLKVRIMKSKEVSRQLKHEIEVYQFLKKASEKFSLNFIFPSILKKGNFQNLDWYLRNFEEGKLAGDMMEDFGYKKFFLNNLSPEKFIKAILSLQKLPEIYLRDLKLFKHGGWWYSQDFKHYQRTLFKFFLKSPFNQNLLTKKEVEKAQEILEKNKKFLDEMSFYPSHGDLYPNNILITNNKKLLILDWELFHLNNQFFDLCFVWLLSHRNKDWQKKFFDLIIKNRPENFEWLFQLVLISLTSRFLGACWQALRKKKKNYPFSLIIKSREFTLLKYFIKIFKLAILGPKNFLNYF
ncbi:MAG: phosphotransferase [Patescibacteria group bacterium]|nr:phosphotransferase [Patescibacteria group bacterium]